jgi:hypothetical protein
MSDEIKFTVKEYEGVVIFAVPPSLTREEAWVLDNYPKDEEGYPILGDPITTEDGIGPGDLVLVPHAFGGFTVMEVYFDEESEELFAESEQWIVALAFNEDDRCCWASVGMINKAVLQNLEISHG